MRVREDEEGDGWGTETHTSCNRHQHHELNFPSSPSLPLLLARPSSLFHSLHPPSTPASSPQRGAFCKAKPSRKRTRRRLPPHSGLPRVQTVRLKTYHYALLHRFLSVEPHVSVHHSLVRRFGYLSYIRFTQLASRHKASAAPSAPSFFSPTGRDETTAFAGQKLGHFCTRSNV